jgi:hypothetical protein
VGSKLVAVEVVLEVTRLKAAPVDQDSRPSSYLEQNPRLEEVGFLLAPLVPRLPLCPAPFSSAARTALRPRTRVGTRRRALTGDQLRNPPDHHVDKGVGSDDRSPANQGGRPSCGRNYQRQRVLSMTSTHRRREGDAAPDAGRGQGLPGFCGRTPVGSTPSLRAKPPPAPGGRGTGGGGRDWAAPFTPAVSPEGRGSCGTRSEVVQSTPKGPLQNPLTSRKGQGRRYPSIRSSPL